MVNLPRSIADAVRVGSERHQEAYQGRRGRRYLRQHRRQAGPQDEATQDEAVADPDKAAYIVKLKTREGHEERRAGEMLRQMRDAGQRAKSGKDWSGRVCTAQTADYVRRCPFSLAACAA